MTAITFSYQTISQYLSGMDMLGLFLMGMELAGRLLAGN
jgi:hypothetical protein